MKKGAVVLTGVAAAVLAGCWTVRGPVAPDVTLGRLPEGREVRVQIVGFDASVTTYVPAYGYATVTTFGGPSCCGPHRRFCDGGIGTSMVSTTEFLPQTAATATYRNRATDALEHAGCILQTTDPHYRMEVRFEGPFAGSGDAWAAFGWSLCTLLTADYGAQEWTAKLKIHDAKTGRLVFERERRQRYEAIVWGPIPFFSPLGSDRTSNAVMQDWCLTVLTDATVADALSFLSAPRAP